MVLLQGSGISLQDFEENLNQFLSGVDPETRVGAGIVKMQFLA